MAVTRLVCTGVLVSLSGPAWAQDAPAKSVETPNSVPPPSASPPAAPSPSALPTPPPTETASEPAAEAESVEKKNVLTRPPELLTSVDADYPPELFDKGITGAVVLLITISEEGVVTDVGLHTSSGQEALDASAMAALRQFKFRPAEIDHAPAPVQILYRYAFTIEKKVEETPVPVAEEKPTGTISGLVLERGTRAPLAGFIIRVPAHGLETVTDAEGRFLFEQVPAGSVEITLDAESHYQEVDEETVEAGKETQVKYYLESKGGGDAVVVVGRRLRKEVARRTITMEEIRRIPGTSGDALKVIQNLPGIARIPFGGGGLIVRGSNPENSQAAVNRHLLPIIFHFGGIRSVLPSELLESIDFYPGNFGAEFGRFSGGVVDVRVRRPRDDRLHGRVEADFFDAGILLEGPVGEHGSFAIAGRRSYIDGLLNAVASNTDGFSLAIAPRYYDYQAIYDWKKGPHRVRVMGFGSDDAFEFIFEESLGNQSSLCCTLENSTSFYRGFLDWEYRASDSFVHSFSVSLGQNAFLVQLGPDFRVESDALITTIRDDFRWKVSDRLQIRGGLDTEIITGDFGGRAPAPPREGGDQGQSFSSREVLDFENDFDIYNPALWASGEIKLFEERLLLVPGMRLDYDSRLEEISFDPRLTARWTVLPDSTVLKAGVGRYMQRPRLDELNEQLGNPDLTYARAIHTSLGFEQRLSPKLELDVVGFYQHLFQLIGSAPRDDDLLSLSSAATPSFTNDGEGRIYGLETLLRWSGDEQFFGWISYTLMRSERRDPGAETYRLFDFDQTHILTILGSYRLTNVWEIGARWRYTTGVPRALFSGSVFNSDQNTYEAIYTPDRTTRVDPFHQLDLRIERRWVYETWILSAYLELQNAYNRANPEARQYNFDFTQSKAVSGLPIIPSLGLRGTF